MLLRPGCRLAQLLSLSNRNAFARPNVLFTSRPVVLVRSSYWDTKIREMERQQEQEVKEARKAVQKPSSKLKGNPKDVEDVRISKTIAWILRHGAKAEGMYMREDGYVKVEDLLASPRLRSLDFQNLERLVHRDPKMRYHLRFEPKAENKPFAEDIWWIRANQGHSINAVDLDHTEITDSGQVPMAVHGTTHEAWQSIATKGLSRMRRQHIHLAQGVPSDKVISGMRKSSKIFIFVDLEKALRAGIKFFLSDNGCILTPGDARGFLPPMFFKLVTNEELQPIIWWKRLPSYTADESVVNGEGVSQMIEALQQASLADVAEAATHPTSSTQVDEGHKEQ